MHAANSRYTRWQPPTRFPLVVPLLALLIFFTLGLRSVIAKAPTADEGMHLLRGQVLWQTGELALQGQHTPLSHWLIGAFLFTEPTIPDVEQLPSWSILSPDRLVQEFLWQSGAMVTRILVLGRLPILFVGMLLGSVLAAWSWQRQGFWGLAITMTLFALSPNLLASAALATTDAVAAAAFTAALFAFYRFWRRPSFWRWLLAALALGLALGSKLTGALLLPLTLVLSYVYWRGQPWWRPGLAWLSMLPVAAVVLWAVYGFESGEVAALPFPVPAATFVNNIVEVQDHIQRGHYAFLLGERSNSGWYHYFGVAFLFKTPAVTLLLLVVTVITLTRRRGWRETTIFWLPAVVLFAVATFSRLNIGYRHILPVIPLIWLFIAESGPFWGATRGATLLLFVALTFYTLGTVRQQPHFLAYFNEFVGGSVQGYRYLGDSNLDWGQDLSLLADYVAESDADKLFVSYFGPSDPAYYGLDKPPLFDEAGNPTGFAPANPAPGRYAISVNHLQGSTEIEPDLFDWFRRLEPVDQLGYSVLIYELSQDDEGVWIGHCFDPEPMVDEETAEQLMGRQGVRHVYFDCRSSWIFPAGGEPGWYIIPQDVDPRPVEDHFPEKLKLVYTNASSSRGPAYSVYHWSGEGDLVRKIAAQGGPITLSDGTPVQAPLLAGDNARFIAGWNDQSLWASIWQAERASEQPLSVLLHLYTEGPDPIVADGLGYAAVQWLPGDLFLQFRAFGDGPGNYLETGLYDYTTGEGLPFDLGDRTEPTVRIHPQP